WPKLVTWQSVKLAEANVSDLLQAPVLFIHGTAAPQFSSDEVKLLDEYVRQGGVLFAVCGCGSAAFDEGFRDFCRRMFPATDSPLRKLDRSHPVFRSEHLLVDAQSGEPSRELWGAEIGCRTAVFYSPVDLAGDWDRWTPFAVPLRSAELQTAMERSL